MVAAFHHSRCYGPTIAELARESGISRSTAFEHIAELRRKGLLSGSAHKARYLSLTSAARELLSLVAERRDSVYGETTGILLCGRVAAGAPLEAVQNAESLSLHSCFGSSDDIFALEVKGDSMIDEDIRDGDYVICRRSSVADNGQLVVAIVDNDNATLKRFYRQSKHARLQPANDAYQPIYSDNCRIEAVVIGLVRKLH
jgi:repressor LexA